MARWSRRRDERGATAVLAAILLTFVLMTSAAFTVDLGQQRVVRSDMQAVADMASLDLSRLLTGGTVSSYSTAVFNTALANSLARNDSSYGDAVTSQGKCSSAGLATTVKAGACWEFADTSGTGEFTPTQTPTAVKVYARSETGFLFGGFTKVNAGGATRDATATSSSDACFRIGSYAARINSSSSTLLNAVINKGLGGNISLDAASYKGLASANVSLLGLATQLHVGTVDQLLATSVSYHDLYLAAASVLTQNGDTADAAVLNSIAGSITGAPAISLGSLISTDSGSGAAETASLNVLDLVQTTAQVANGSSAISVPNLAANLGVASATASLSIIQPATLLTCDVANGSKRAKTAQVSLSASSTLTPPSLSGLTVSGSTSVSVTAAPAQGRLTGITCGSLSQTNPSGEDVSVASSLVGASLTETLKVSGSTADSGLLSGLGGIASVKISGKVVVEADTTDSGASTTAQIRVPNSPTSFSVPVDTGSGSLGLDSTKLTVIANTLDIKVSLLGIIYIDASADQAAQLLSNLLSSVNTSTLISDANTTLLQPLEGTLGLSLGGADVFGSNPSCGNPELIG